MQLLVGVDGRSAGIEQCTAFLLGIDEMLMQDRGVGVFEIVPGIFLFGLQENVAISDLAGPLDAVEVQVVDIVDALNIPVRPAGTRPRK